MQTRFATFFLLAVSAANAQVDVSAYIGSAIEAPSYKNIDAKLDFLQPKSYRLSPLQKLEFRTQNRELLSYQQEYAIRFTPANPWEVKNNNRYFSAYQSFLSLEKSLALREVLLERYQQIIDYVYYVELKELHQAGKRSLEKQVRVLEAQSTSSVFKPEDFVEAKIALVDKDADIEEVSLEILLQESEVARVTGIQAALSWKLEDMLSVEKMRRVVDSLQQQATLSSLVAYQRQKIQVREREYYLEKSNVNIGFFQTEYDRRRVEQGRTPYNISLGITIPITNPNKGDMARKKMDMIDAEYDLKQTETAETAARESAYQQFVQTYTRFEELAKKIDALVSSDFARQLSTRQDGSPMAYIQFEESLLRLKSVKLKLWRKTVSKYVEFLAASDHLQKTPLVNFLSPTVSAAR